MAQGLKGLIELLSLYLKGFTPVEFVRGNDRITQHASGWRVNGSGHLERAKDAVAYLEQAPAEEWRQVYCGINLFLVSDRGNVKKHDGTPAETFVLNGRVQIKYQIVKFGRLRNREIYRSHLVAMAFLNYQRGDEREIHHINGYRMDDSVANLVVLSREDHAKVHAFGATAPTGPVEDAMPLPKQRAKKGAKAPRGKHVGAPVGPGYVDFKAEARSVVGVPSVEEAEGDRTAEDAPSRSSKRRRGKSTAKRRVEQRRAEEEAKEASGVAPQQPEATGVEAEECRENDPGLNAALPQANDVAEKAGVSDRAADRPEEAETVASLAVAEDALAGIGEELGAEVEAEEGASGTEATSADGEPRGEGRKRPRRHRGGRRRRRKRTDGEAADAALSAAIDSAEEAVADEPGEAGQSVAANVAETAGKAAMDGEVSVDEEPAVSEERPAAVEDAAVEPAVEDAADEPAAEDEPVETAAEDAAGKPSAENESVETTAAYAVVDDVEFPMPTDVVDEDEEFPMPTDVADELEPLAAEVVDEVSGVEEAQTFAEEVQEAVGHVQETAEEVQEAVGHVQETAEEARETAANVQEEVGQEQDWDALRERFTDELDRFLSGFTDKDAAAGGDAAGKARGRQVKAVYGALRPFHSCDDAVMLFDTALAGVRRLNLFATERDEKAPGVVVGVLSQMNHLLKCACEQLAGADDVARACTVELLEEEASSPVYRKLGYAAKLRKCARTVRDGIGGTETAEEAVQGEGSNGDDGVAQDVAVSDAVRSDDAAPARRRPRHRRRRPGKRERARRPRPDMGEASGRRGSAAVGGAVSSDEN